jgi:hypothetical protein
VQHRGSVLTTTAPTRAACRTARARARSTARPPCAATSRMVRTSPTPSLSMVATQAPLPTGVHARACAQNANACSPAQARRSMSVMLRDNPRRLLTRRACGAEQKEQSNTPTRTSKRYVCGLLRNYTAASATSAQQQPVPRRQISSPRRNDPAPRQRPYNPAPLDAARGVATEELGALRRLERFGVGALDCKSLEAGAGRGGHVLGRTAEAESPLAALLAAAAQLVVPPS